ncbi:MAG: aldehyde dehydrogenase family protein [Deltaproteobacteria bacterium]|nr:MAG: aldehyde dehydrogenase family protein [Deltaproteobacteria bacterium]
MKQLYVGGTWVPGSGEREVRSPWDDRIVGSVALAGAQEIEAALAAASNARPDLARSTAFERAAWLEAIARGIREREADFIDTLVAEGGKPVRFARGEVARAIETFTFAAAEVRTLAGEVLPLDAAKNGSGRIGIARRVPAGVVTAITPFNFPLNLVAHKMAPALAAGCPLVLKPPDETPLCSLMLAEIVSGLDVPAGGVNVVPCEVEDARPLVEDPRPAVLSFTGSAAVGWSLKAKAGRKRVLLELGGNAAAVVHSDADLELAAERCALGAFAHAGQVCISVQRIYVHAPVYERFVEALVARTQALGVGDPRDEETVVGPLRADRDVERVMAWMAQAEAAGGRRRCGGVRDGRVLTPSVWTDVPETQPLACDEVFGPVVVVYPYERFEEALRRVNASEYGLQAGVFTRDVGRLWHAFEALEVGGVIHDDAPTFRVDPMPYGGVKKSGLGREGLRYAIEAMSEIRLLVMRPGAGATGA